MSKKVEFGFAESPFGEIIVARTWDGVCDLQFLDFNRMETIRELAARWGMYTPTTQSDVMAQTVEKVAFEGLDHPLTFDVKGTEFQLKVWKELRNIPFGTTATYQQIAERIGQPKAVRAVATAIGQNPVAMLIPCHRVIHSDGTLGEYHWGRDLKKQILEWEAAKVKEQS
jgi:AraC family transcriptional regulator of adaptative response/methylated-DNA-[protein]-cysteine methyltransferase